LLCTGVMFGILHCCCCNRALRDKDTSDYGTINMVLRHFGTIPEVSGQFGYGPEVLQDTLGPCRTV